jgi:uncharacterized membrane protein
MALKFLNDGYFAGKVGIGTTSPEGKLQINGGNGQRFIISNTGIGDNQDYGAVAWKNPSGTLFANIALLGNANSSTDGSARLSLGVRAATGATTVVESMTIQSSGNVGIGTISPSTKLHVAGIAQVAESGNSAFYGGNYVRVFNDQNYGFRNTGGTYIANISMSGNSYFNGGNVGIGTSSPAARLEVRSDGSVAGGAEIRLQHANNNTNDVVSTVNFANNAGSIGMIQAGTAGANNTGYIALFTDIAGASSERMRVHTNGNVGIGTTSPQTELHIKGNNGWGEVRIEGQTFASGHGASLEFYSGGTALADIYANTSKDLILRTNGTTERMRLTSSGNVGIGTTSPGAKLDVADSIPVLRITGTRDASWTIGQTMASLEYFSEDASGSAANSVRASINLVNETSVYGSTTGLSFSTKGDVAGSPIEAMRINSSGNVGIGTDNPTSNLHIAGTGDQWLFVNSLDGNTSGIRLQTSNNTRQNVLYRDSTSNLLTLRNGMDNGEIAFIAGGENAERIRIDSTGGIGTTTPGYKLSVNGDIQSDILRGYQYPINSLIDFDDDTFPGSLINSVSIKSTGSMGFMLDSNNNGTADAFIWAKDSLDFSAGTELMRLTNGGNVGIGTTAPGTKLQVSDTIAGYVSTIENLGIGADKSGLWIKTDSTWTSAIILKLTGGTSDVSIMEVNPATVRIGGGAITQNDQALHLPDNKRIGLGDSGDLQIYHDGSNSYITDSGTGNLRIRSTSLRLENTDSSNMVVANGGGSVAIYYNGSAKFSTTNTGVSVTGDVTASGTVNADTYFQSTDASAVLATNGAGSVFLRPNGPGSGTGALSVVSSGNVVALGTVTGTTFTTSAATGWLVKNSGGNHGISYDGTDTVIQNNGVYSIRANGTSVYLRNTYITGLLDVTAGGTFAGTVTSPTFLGDLNGTINTATTAVTKANATNDTTVATTAFVQNLIGTIPAGLVFQGTWNAATNTPTLTSGSGTTGHFYIVSTSGSTNLDGVTDWVTGDWAVFIEQGATDAWEKVDNSSVLDGAGTGQTVALWSGSGTSNTLDDSILTQSGGSIITQTATSVAQYSLDSIAANDSVVNFKQVGVQKAKIGYDHSEDALAFIHGSGAFSTAGMVLDGTGVGIGTASPDFKLHVAHSDGNNGLLLEHKDQASGFQILQNIRETEGLIWQRWANGVFANNLMTLDYSGNVGIGTTIPNKKLHIVGVSNGSENDTPLFIQSNISTLGYGLAISRDNSPTVAALSLGADSSNNGVIASNDSDLRVGKSTSGVFSEAMRITSTGNVGIGTTTPFEKLQANGNIYAENRIISADATNANQNLLTQADIKISNQNDIYGNLTKVIISPYEAAYTSDGTGSSTIRLDSETAMTPGAIHTFSIYYKDLIGSLSIDLYDVAASGSYTSAIGTAAAPASGRLYGYAQKASTGAGAGYNFVDINLTNNGSVTLLNPKLETGKVVTEFIATTETQAIPQTITTNNLRATGSIQMGDDDTTATADKVGTLKYRVSGNNSYVDMCMQTGAATYEWVNIVQNNW